MRLRYFDPARRRAGLPQDVAALITAMDADSARLTLVNVNVVEPRMVIVQGGAYGEHEIGEVELDGKRTAFGGSWFTVRLAPGAGGELVIHDRRYANRPTARMPWDR